MSLGLSIIIFICLLILSGIFSGSETALFGARKDALRSLKSNAAKRTLKLLGKPQKLLISILIGNTLVNIALTVLTTVIVYRLSNQYGLHHLLTAFLEIVVVTLLVLIFGEVIPKTISLHNAEKTGMRMSILIGIFYTLFFPLTLVLYFISRIAEKALRIKHDKLIHNENDIKTLVQIGEERGEFQEKEIEMITSLLESTETCVREIMIPRPDMVAVDAGRSLADIFSFVSNQRFARFPVYRNDLDNIIGFISEKDILAYLDAKDAVTIDALIRPPLFLPEQCSVSRAISVFQEKKTKIAIVVDEYGGTSGLVTLEDAIEEIVGDIRDENEAGSNMLKWLTRNECAVNAAINLDELEEILGIKFPEERVYDTLGGFVMDRLGRIPGRHDAFRYQNHIFIVDEMEHKRIQRIRIIRAQHKTANSHEKL
ncbi:MAG: hemolysin family protein [Candidatus Marinimicrobia bacterium]|nr:hemolysin family protein [Candidatus Neomarinimicrobiota bacterium]MDD4960880.1 hemolysin family protein [Candidatus Neomarinimicrobiota bacterium]MDD5709343.1 hemolysin family protein [Candidatus Neomarinimicrobiota bacterium]MDX9778182.1 hemolysin family protein [bacterium]